MALNCNFFVFFQGNISNLLIIFFFIPYKNQDTYILLSLLFLCILFLLRRYWILLFYYKTQHLYCIPLFFLFNSFLFSLISSSVILPSFSHNSAFISVIFLYWWSSELPVICIEDWKIQKICSIIIKKIKIDFLCYCS